MLAISGSFQRATRPTSGSSFYRRVNDGIDKDTSSLSYVSVDDVAGAAPGEDGRCPCLLPDSCPSSRQAVAGHAVARQFVRRLHTAIRTSLRSTHFLGVEMAHHKTEGPTTRLTILGIEFNTVAMELHLPADKLQQLIGLLAWQAVRAATGSRVVGGVVGMLQQASSVVRQGHIILRHIWPRPTTLSLTTGSASARSIRPTSNGGALSCKRETALRFYARCRWFPLTLNSGQMRQEAGAVAPTGRDSSSRSFGFHFHWRRNVSRPRSCSPS